jgi:hypothetical protein
MSAEFNDGGPAFPSQTTEEGWTKDHFPDMTLRDYFAAEALPAVCSMVNAGTHQRGPADASGADWIATSAYRLADAMLAARVSPPDAKEGL